MAVTFNKPELCPDTMCWRVSWTSTETAPVTFRVFRDGQQISSFTSPDQSGEITVSVPPGEHVVIDVLDTASQVPAKVFPARMTVHWESVSDAVKYRVEEFVASVWTLRQEIVDSGAGAYTWLSRDLEDVTTHQFRVIPVDAADNQGTALTFSTLMVRYPAPPDVTFSYDGAGPKTVTISAA